jgi:hypothetical protein
MPDHRLIYDAETKRVIAYGPAVGNVSTQKALFLGTQAECDAQIASLGLIPLPAKPQLSQRETIRRALKADLAAVTDVAALAKALNWKPAITDSFDAGVPLPVIKAQIAGINTDGNTICDTLKTTMLSRFPSE